MDRGPGEAVRACDGPAETRGDTRHRPAAHGGAETRGASGARRADSRGVQGWGRDLARPEDGDDAQAPLLAHWAACDVYAGHAEQEGRRGFGHGGSLRRGCVDERSTPCERGCAPSVGEEPEVTDLDEAAREDVEEKAGQELGGRQGHRPHAVPPGVVFPPACREPSRTEAHLAGVHADQPVIGDRHAVGIAAEVLEDLGRPGDRRLGFVVSSAERRPRPSREHGAGGAIRGLRHMRITGTQ